MGKLGDLFQQVMAIPMGVTNEADRQAVWNNLAQVLSDIETLAVQIPATGAALVPTARAEYLEMLAKRGRHLLAKATAFVAALGAAPAFVPVNPPEDQQLRDFYHHVYYATFYAARFGVVTQGHFDDSEHKAIPTALDALAKKVVSTNPVRHSLLKSTESTLQRLKNYRNMADYIMNGAKLSVLATPGTVFWAESTVSQLYTDWGIP